MAFHIFRKTRLDLAVPGADFRLSLLQHEHFESWSRVREANRSHLQPFEPSWSQNILTHESFRRQVRNAHRDLGADRGAALLLIHLDTDEVIGGINMRNIRRGAADMGTLGYWMSAEFGGEGRMKRAVGRVVQFGFTAYDLHRIEAACVPENIASAAILLANGFEEEGFAKAYLQINGRWRDHRLFAIVRPDEHIHERTFTIT